MRTSGVRDRRDAERSGYWSAVGPERREEALETLEIGRLSWRLRDNDNLLLARVESQLIRAIDVAAEAAQVRRAVLVPWSQGHGQGSSSDHRSLA